MICSYTVGSRKAEAWQSEGQGQSPWPQVLLQCCVLGYHRCFCMTGLVKLSSWASQKVVDVAAAAAQNKWICFCRTSLIEGARPIPVFIHMGRAEEGLRAGLHSVKPRLKLSVLLTAPEYTSTGFSQAETVFLGQRHATQERRTGM